MATTLGPFMLGLMLGGMGFFSFMIAPTAFRVLAEADAARFVRRLFPGYWLFTIVTAVLAAVALVGPAPWLSMLMTAAAALGVLGRQVLTPRINALRDRHLAGDAAAGRWFGRLHGAAVGVNGLQMAAAATALALSL